MIYGKTRHLTLVTNISFHKVLYSSSIAIIYNIDYSYTTTTTTTTTANHEQACGCFGTVGTRRSTINIYVSKKYFSLYRPGGYVICVLVDD